MVSIPYLRESTSKLLDDTQYPLRGVLFQFPTCGKALLNKSLIRSLTRN